MKENTNSQTDQPNPGSVKAVEMGCRCAIIDNHFGKGIPTKKGRMFWINISCPLHGGRGWHKND